MHRIRQRGEGEGKPESAHAYAKDCPTRISRTKIPKGEKTEIKSSHPRETEEGMVSLILRGESSGKSSVLD